MPAPEQKIYDMINDSTKRYKPATRLLRAAREAILAQNPMLAGWHLCRASELLRKTDHLAAEEVYRIVWLFKL